MTDKVYRHEPTKWEPDGVNGEYTKDRYELVKWDMGCLILQDRTTEGVPLSFIAVGFTPDQCKAMFELWRVKDSPWWDDETLGEVMEFEGYKIGRVHNSRLARFKVEGRGLMLHGRPTKESILNRIKEHIKERDYEI